MSGLPNTPHPSSEERTWTLMVCEECGNAVAPHSPGLCPEFRENHRHTDVPGPDRGRNVKRHPVEVVPASSLTQAQQERDGANARANHYLGQARYWQQQHEAVEQQRDELREALGKIEECCREEWHRDTLGAYRPIKSARPDTALAIAQCALSTKEEPELSRPGQVGEDAPR